VDDDEARKIRKRLDEVVGTRFDPDARAGLFGRIRRRSLTWLGAAALAIGAASLVVYTIESHRLPSQEKVNAVKSSKPVEIFVLPAPAAPAKR
jgi:hypothetical protein